jgi:hypothetical protein
MLEASKFLFVVSYRGTREIILDFIEAVKRYVPFG